MAFRSSRHDDNLDIDDYNRQVQSRPGYVAGGYSGVPPYEYTGQPVGFEHLGSPPKQRFEDMDARTIAQLGYEGPEGERRKVEAINEQIYEREYERERPGYSHAVPINAVPIRSDGYGRPDTVIYDHGLPGEVPRYTTASSIDRRNQQEEEYRRASRHGVIAVDPYSPSRRPGPGYVVPVLPVTVDRKFEEDGTVVEHVYPDSTAAAAFSPRDRGKIHYGRQDSYPETVLQEAASHYRGGGYPVGYSRERPPPAGYTVPYSDGTYGRRPYGSPHGSSSGYVDDRYRR